MESLSVDLIGNSGMKYELCLLFISGLQSFSHHFSVLAQLTWKPRANDDAKISMRYQVVSTVKKENKKQVELSQVKPHHAIE